MATVTTTETQAHQATAEPRIVLRGVGWDVYETLLHRLAGQPIRLTYDRGDLELMAPSYDHEHFKKLLGRFVETVTEELEIPCASAGSMTLRRQIQDRGLEPDDCFYLASLLLVTGKVPDLDTDPPPDLAIEVEISRGVLDRMGIYAALKVPEVWRFDGSTPSIAILQPDGTYVWGRTIPGLPFLSSAEVEAWVGKLEPLGDASRWGRELREWVRAVLAPRLARPE